MPPALAGRLLTSEPPGKSETLFFNSFHVGCLRKKHLAFPRDAYLCGHMIILINKTSEDFCFPNMHITPFSTLEWV